METAILLVIYKRADTTRKVFDMIRNARPSKLYIAANAPNPLKPSDIMDCQKTREVTEHVDWDCNVKRLYRTNHLEAGDSVRTSIDWLFENEECGIIFEDDCVPHPDFFRYCDEMLLRYKDDNRISQITGRNFMGYYKNNGASYFLSALHYSWGWASWRRVWHDFDYNLNDITFTKYLKSLYQLFGLSPFIIMWRLNLYMTCKLYPKSVNTWDYQFAITTQIKGTFTIVPCVNMITNIGFDSRATHTVADGKVDIGSSGIYPLNHPDTLSYDNRFDKLHAKGRYKMVSVIYNFIKLSFLYLIHH